MALYLTNISALSAQRYLSNATNALDTVYKRLSSGLRINSAKDDAAGLQIANRMTSQIKGLMQANRNASDGIALAQVAEGAMDEMTTMYQKLRTMAIQSANGTNTSLDREAIQKEALALSSEITRISQKTTYNGATLLSGANDKNSILQNGKISLQVGAYANDTIDINLSQGYSTYQTITTSLFGDYKDPSDVVLNVQVIADADYLSEFDSHDDISAGIDMANGEIKISATQANQLLSGKTASANITNGTIAAGNLAISKEQMFDLIDGSLKEGSLGNDFLKAVYGFSVIGNKVADTSTNVKVNSLQIDLSTAKSSQAAINNIDKYIANVDGARADLGAIQNRLESTIRNQSNIMENTMDARSRILDTDYAQESAALIQNTIMQQAALSMLQQANQRTNLILSLLGQ